MARQHDAPPPEGNGHPGMRSALWLPLFDELADPAVVARLAAEAEQAGWHGVFVWDQLRWRPPVRQVADPWITLAAIATATRQVRLGPMVTPLARRRPAKVARETATLDLLSGGRLTLGVGLGDDRFAGEFSKTGEQLDDRARGQMLDEALEILVAAWSGAPVHHHGVHYTVDDVQFLPRPVQQPGMPVWVAGFPGNRKPLRRAARYDGFFPANLEHPDQLAEVVTTIAELRQDTPGPFDFAVGLPVGVDPAPWAKVGATWWLPEFAPEELSLDLVRSVLRDGNPDFSNGFAARTEARVDRLFQILKASATPLNLGDPGRTGAGVPDAVRAVSGQTGAVPPTPAAVVPAAVAQVLTQLREEFTAAGLI